MLRKNNRGAGIVTVVVVLAVCGILLAGVLGFAYQHYKNVMLSSANDAELAEIELCSQLLLKHLNSNKTDLNSNKTDLDAEGSVLNAFYAYETESIDKTEVITSVDGVYTIRLSGGKSLRLTSEEVDSLQKYTIVYLSGVEEVFSREYYFAKDNGTYSFAEKPQEDAS